MSELIEKLKENNGNHWFWHTLINNKDNVKVILDNDETHIYFKAEDESIKLDEPLGNHHGIFFLLEYIGLEAEAA